MTAKSSESRRTHWNKLLSIHCLTFKILSISMAPRRSEFSKVFENLAKFRSPMPAILKHFSTAGSRNTSDVCALV